jgi:AraC-like DNA-binding protein
MQLSLCNSRLDCIGEWESLAERAGYSPAGLAKICGVSQRHLRRWFQLRKGICPARWLAEQRLARGAASLQQGMLVKEASEQAGFKDPAHFTRKFIQHYGVSPSAYRSRCAA